MQNDSIPLNCLLPKPYITSANEFPLCSFGPDLILVGVAYVDDPQLVTLDYCARSVREVIRTALLCIQVNWRPADWTFFVEHAHSSNDS